MSNLLSELEAVVGLADLATPNDWQTDGPHLFTDTRVQVCCGRGHQECCGSPDIDGDVEEVGSTLDENDAYLTAAAVNFLRTHHAEIAAAVRDAARYRWLRDHQFSFTHDQHKRGIASTRWGEWVDVDDAETLDLCIDTVMRDGSDHDRKVAAMSAREGQG